MTETSTAPTPPVPGAPPEPGRPSPPAGVRTESAPPVPSGRVDELLAAMSVREKVGQLNQRLYGWQCVRRGPRGYELTDLFHEEAARWSGLGALYGLFRADAWSGRDWATGIPPQDRAEVADLVGRAARSHSPHGVAPLLVEEAPHGHQALGGPLLPVNLTVGATWDPGLYGEASAAVSAVLRADGVHLALVSALDLLRDPRWGRSEECYGEDPYLAARYAAALVEGMQGPGRSRVHDGTGVGIVLKHFAAQGEGVGGRNGHSASIGPRDLAELHLPAARAGVEAGALGVMAAYNDIDGVPCIANADLLTGLLRGAWGFDGIVMADGKAVDRLRDPLGSLRAGAATALAAGVDLSLWDESYALLEDVVAEHPALAGALDDAVRRVLGVKARFGLLGERPGGKTGSVAGRERVSAASRHGARTVVHDTAVRLSTRLAVRSTVLLADRGVLPARPRPGSRWAVVGPHADLATSLLGDYVPPLADVERRSLLTALADRAATAGAEVVHLPGAPSVADLAGADLVVAVVGGTSHRGEDDEFADNGAVAGSTEADCGEGVDRADLRLPADQDDFLRAVRAATAAPLVAVVVAGRPYVLTGLLDTADAVVLAGYPGPYGADPVAAVLCGDAQPVGRLPATWPAHHGVVPARHDERIDPDGVYRDVPRTAAAPFGAGLGYAPVLLAGSRATRTRDGVRVEVDVVGGDPRPGWDGPAEEVVRLHARRRGGLAWPRRSELVAFARVALAAGERSTVVLDVPGEAAFVDPSEAPPLAHVATTFTVAVGAARHDHEVAADGRVPPP